MNTNELEKTKQYVEELRLQNELGELEESISFRKHQLKMQPLEEFSSECEVSRRNIETIIKLYSLQSPKTEAFTAKNKDLLSEILKSNLEVLKK